MKMDTPDTKKIAEDVAKQFGEVGERPRRQLERIAMLLGSVWLADIAERAERGLRDAEPFVTRADGSLRTRGGVLFAVARGAAFDLVKSGALGRRDFHRSFCWREPTPRECGGPSAPPKSSPRPKPKVESPPRHPAPRHGRVLQAEVYTVRRSKQ